MSQNQCSCGSEQAYSNCCEPIIRGKKRAQTAVELMRARYSAFVHGEIDFILETHHSRTRGETQREDIETWSRNSQWLGLEVHSTEGGGPNDASGIVIFCARYVYQGKLEEHWEKSLFEKESGEWRFVDVLPMATAPVVRDAPKIGRNDPCSCGSGKKFKKCCGSNS